MKRFGLAALCAVTLISFSCSGDKKSIEEPRSGYCTFAKYFDVIADSASTKVVSISPFGAAPDTLDVTRPLGSIVCMSSSYVAALDLVGSLETVSGISGIDYISNEKLRKRYEEGLVKDVGYDPAIDYESIVSMHPDLVAAYGIGTHEPQFASKLRSLGIRVFTLYDQFEQDPLGRAEYLRFFGALTGRLHSADSAFIEVATHYMDINAKVASHRRDTARVLMNIPYGGVWYVPGGSGYMARLVRDAGGRILGSEAGKTESSTMSMEKAFALSDSADFWLNTGWCRTRKELDSCDPMFPKFKISKVYNNILKQTAGGGNDFWESGAVRPDLILEDLAAIFAGKDSLFNYYIKVD